MLFTAIAWVVIVAFALTFVVTILALCKVIKIRQGYLRLLFTKMILEVIAGGFYLFYTGLGTFPTADISGEWKYRCTQHGQNYQHGGVCTITKEGAGFVPSYRITGQRLWTHRWTDADAGKIVDYPSPLTWTSEWAAQTDQDSVKFIYTISTPTGTVRGFADGKLHAEGGKVSLIFGSFYQLPPFEPLFGAIEFRPRTGDNDVAWKDSVN